MLSKVEEVLKDPELPAASLESLVRTMEELLDCIHPEEEELFDLHLGAAILLPLPTLQELSSPSNCGLRRAVLYRSALARSQGTKTRLTCLNDVIEAACAVHHCSELLPALQVCPSCSPISSFPFQAVATLSRTGPPQPSSAWLLELMGQTNLLLRHPTSNTPSALAVLLDVFTVAVVVLSESDSLLLPSTLAATCPTTRLDILPLALHRLLRIHPGMAGTLATWLQVFFSCVLPCI